VYAISRYTRNLLQQQCPDVSNSAIKLTPLGVAGFWFEPVADRLNIRRLLGIPLEDQVVLTVARLDPRKGHQLVLRSLQGLDADIRKRTTYVIAGDGDNQYRETLETQSGSAGVRVIFARNLDDEAIRALYATSTVFCMPGELNTRKVEGFGLAYLEAAAQHLPSIGSSIGAVPEVVEDGRTGLIVGPNSVSELTRALNRILKDDLLRSQLSKNAAMKARQLTWEQTAIATYGGPR
jgi:glycosyltransferase involved in cell wall biosynthesis